MADIVADSGSIVDLQTAIDFCISGGGGTVTIPSGTFDWDLSGFGSGESGYVNVINFAVPVGGITIQGAGKTNTIINVTSEPSSDPDGVRLFSASNATGGVVVFKDFKTGGYATDEVYNTSSIGLYDCFDYIIRDMSFIDFSNTAIYIDYGRGVIYNCDFDNPYKDIVGDSVWAYGIIVTDRNYTNAFPDITPYLGGYDGLDNVHYIEGCTFNMCRHSIASAQSAYYCVRHCTFTEPRAKNFGIIDVHEGATGIAIGGIGCESYNNTLYAASEYGSSQGFWLRAGQSTVYDNDGVDLLHMVMLFYHDAEATDNVSNTYVWDNLNNDIPANVTFAAAPLAEGVDYFQYPRPDYTPYTYPHPLIGEGGGGV